MKEIPHRSGVGVVVCQVAPLELGPAMGSCDNPRSASSGVPQRTFLTSHMGSTVRESQKGNIRD